MAGGCQTAGERPYFNCGTAHIKKRIVRLGYMQEAHKNLNFSSFCSARLQAGTFESSTCSPEGERYTAWPGGWLIISIAREKIQKVFPCRGLYSPEQLSNWKLVNSLLFLGKNI